MRRVIAIANGKGGVGNTSLTTGLGGLLAAGGYRVLTVDADPQANLRRDLGYAGTDGRALANAIQFGAPLEPVSDVREKLDAVPGGAALYDVPATHISRMSRGEQLHGLRAALADVRPRGRAPDYLVRSVSPGTPAVAGVIGDNELVDCKRTPATFAEGVG